MADAFVIEGLERLNKKLGLTMLGDSFLARPLKKFWDRIGVTVQAESRKLAPVDSGRLRQSIAYEQDERPLPLFVHIGSAVGYAPFMEYGTGLLTDGEGGSGQAHYPPAEALNVWGQRRGGASGARIARAIGKAGGLRPRRYLRGGIEKSMSAIRSHVRRLAQDIQSEWSRR
jgi:hypothetical protein